MNVNSIVARARKLVEKRGGKDALKRDVDELRDIAKGPGSLTDKARAAADALKDPGAGGPDTTTSASADAPAPGTPPASGPESGDQRA